MNALTIFISALTAFIITAGCSIGLSIATLKGGMPDKIIWILACVLGLGSAAKDTRSLLKLPPVNGNSESPTEPPK